MDIIFIILMAFIHAQSLKEKEIMPKIRKGVEWQSWVKSYYGTHSVEVKLMNKKDARDRSIEMINRGKRKFRQWESCFIRNSRTGEEITIIAGQHNEIDYNLWKINP